MRYFIMSKLIYVVDDESNIRTMMQLFLENEGFTVETFKDGQEACQAFSAKEPDMLILDIMMPGMSGIDASQIDEKAFDRIEAMIYSMTKAEREDPSIINPKRKRRIAAGSGTQVSDVNKLLKQFEMMQKMMKQFKKSPKGFARKLGGLMGSPGAFRGMK